MKDQILLHLCLLVYITLATFELMAIFGIIGECNGSIFASCAIYFCCIVQAIYMLEIRAKIIAR
jgi:hypothetical protein